MQKGSKEISKGTLFSRSTEYWNVLGAMALCLLGILIYAHTFYYPFHFDDTCYIIRNISLRNVFDLKPIWEFYPTRFIAFITFGINYYFHQLNVFGYHIVNLLIHIMTSMLVWYFVAFTLTTPRIKKESSNIENYANIIGFMAALIFLTHPVQTESVTYIWQRVTELSGFFYMFSLCLYVKARFSFLNRDVTAYWSAYIFSLAFCCIGMFTKENIFTLPLMILLYELFFFAEGSSVEWKRITPYLMMLPIIPLTMFLMKSENFKVVQQFMIDPAEGYHYFLTQFKAMIKYLQLLFIPMNQSIDYYFPFSKSIFEPATFFSFIIVIALLILAMAMFKRHRLIAFGILWFFLTLLPESSIFPLKDEAIFEHRLYLPMAGYCIFAVAYLYNSFGKKSLKPVYLIIVIFISIYSIFSYSRNFVWRNEFSLWNDAIARSPQKARPYHWRGNAYHAIGKLDKAISDYTKAIQLSPDSVVRAYYDRGNAYLDSGDADKAILDYDSALKINPSLAKAYNNRGIAYYNKRDIDKAIFDFNKAIEIDPNLAECYYNRAMAYLAKEEYKKGEEDFIKAEALGFDVKR